MLLFQQPMNRKWKENYAIPYEWKECEFIAFALMEHKEKRDSNYAASAKH